MGTGLENRQVFCNSNGLRTALGKARGHAQLFFVVVAVAQQSARASFRKSWLARG